MAKEKAEKKEDTLERLFEEFFIRASNTFDTLEMRYGITGVVEQIFGESGDVEARKQKLRNSPAWHTLSLAYRYAVDGIHPGVNYDGEDSLVIDASEILILANSEEDKPKDKWDQVIWMGDGRYALDQGEPVQFEKLAFLAGVDVRTVRNALSAGELVEAKHWLYKDLYIENASARKWLLNRRAFKPTVYENQGFEYRANDVQSPGDFAALLTAQRKKLERGELPKAAGSDHPALTPENLAKLENGVFDVPLDAVFPIADYYHLDRKEFISCVMRVFYAAELKTLASTA